MRNRLREILRRGEVALGISVSIGHPFITDILGGIGFDFINFDLQHAPLSVESTLSMMQAMSFSETTPIMRVPWNEFAIINSVLDIGAHGIIIPFVNTREDVLKAIRYATYPPKGMRSYGPIRASLRDPKYVETCDEEILILPQIETQEGLDNVEDILSLDRIEAFFVGPYDLSRSLGVWREWDNPKFEEAIQRILDAAENTGTVPGVLALFEDVQKTIERGFKLICIGRDVRFLKQAAASALQRAKNMKNEAEKK